MNSKQNKKFLYITSPSFTVLLLVLYYIITYTKHTQSSSTLMEEKPYKTINYSLLL